MSVRVKTNEVFDLLEMNLNTTLVSVRVQVVIKDLNPASEFKYNSCVGSRSLKFADIL